MTKKMLGGAYELDGAQETIGFYKEWSKTYDEEINLNGYVTPERCAEALASFMNDKTAPVLDLGCGTGISGQALKAAGFSCVDGSDLTAEMIELAKEKNVYRNTIHTTLEDPFPFEVGQYSAISAVGVLNPGHAPAETLDEIMQLLEPDGLFVFSLNDHAMEDRSYEARLNEHVDCGSATLLFRDYGPHLPGVGLMANVYVLKKQ